MNIWRSSFLTRTRHRLYLSWLQFMLLMLPFHCRANQGSMLPFHWRANRGSSPGPVMGQLEVPAACTDPSLLANIQWLRLIGNQTFRTSNKRRHLKRRWLSKGLAMEAQAWIPSTHIKARSEMRAPSAQEAEGRQAPRSFWPLKRWGEKRRHLMLPLVSTDTSTTDTRTGSVAVKPPH